MLVGGVIGGLWGGVSIIIAHTINETAKMEVMSIIILPFYISWLLLQGNILRSLVYTPIPAIVIFFHFYILPILVGVIIGICPSLLLSFYRKNFKK